MPRVVLMVFPPPGELDASQPVTRQRTQSRIALARCAVLVGAPQDGWRQDERDRPIANDGFHWSIAHKRDCVVAAIADRAVGVDVERIKPRTNGHFDEVADADEWAILGGRSLRSFFRLWTAKEAVLKFTGAGMAGWDDCRVIGDSGGGRLTLAVKGSTVEVEHFEHADYIAAVATCGCVEWTVCSPEGDSL